MKQLFLVFASLLLTVTTGLSQYEFSSFTSTGRGGATTFATDYQAVGINPANLGWEYQFDDKKIAFGFNEFTFSLHSDALSKQDLRNNIRSLFDSDSTTGFSYDEKIAAAKSFSDAGLALNFDYGSVGFAFMTEKLGGIGFRINDRVQWWSKLGATASDLLFRGKYANYFDSLVYIDPNTLDTTLLSNHQNYSPDTLNNIASGYASVPLPLNQILNGSELSLSWTREYNVSYGRKILGIDDKFMLYGGVGVKYVQGMAYMQIESKEGKLNGFSAITPFFDIDYGAASLTNPNVVTQPKGSLFPKPVGQGWGFDFGLNAIIKNKLKVGLAVTNIGTINWEGNVYRVKDTLLINTDNAGLNNYNLFSQLNKLVGKNGVAKWKGLESKKVALPTLVRLGASLRFGKKLELGADLLLPTNEVPGSLEGALIGLGGDFTPVRWVNLSAGFVTGGNYGPQVPVGITFIAGNGKWEAGVASRDAINFFTKNGPTISLSMGFLRFRL